MYHVQNYASSSTITVTTKLLNHYSMTSCLYLLLNNICNTTNCTSCLVIDLLQYCFVIIIFIHLFIYLFISFDLQKIDVKNILLTVLANHWLLQLAEYLMCVLFIMYIYNFANPVLNKHTVLYCKLKSYCQAMT